MYQAIPGKSFELLFPGLPNDFNKLKKCLKPLNSVPTPLSP